MKIAVVGLNSEGLSYAVLFAMFHDVYIYGKDSSAVDSVNSGKSPFSDAGLEEYLRTKQLRIKATVNLRQACSNADYVIITVTSEEHTKYGELDINETDDAIKEVLRFCPDALTAVQSFVRVDFVSKMCDKYNTKKIISFPCFASEGDSFRGIAYPSKIVLGAYDEEKERAAVFADVLKECVLVRDIPVFLLKPSEAEAVKLFSDMFFSMRTVLFNEIDTYSDRKGFNSRDVISAISCDPFIGDFINNPSFGQRGDCCVPEDMKRLLAQRSGMPWTVCNAIVRLNSERCDFLTSKIIDKANAVDKDNPVIGFYRLTMEPRQTDFRRSAMVSVLKKLDSFGYDLLIYEPLVKEETYFDIDVVKDIGEFKCKCDIIVSNRNDESLKDVSYKVYTRDVFADKK